MIGFHHLLALEPVATGAKHLVSPPPVAFHMQGASISSMRPSPEGKQPRVRLVNITGLYLPLALPSPIFVNPRDPL